MVLFGSTQGATHQHHYYQLLHGNRFHLRNSPPLPSLLPVDSNLLPHTPAPAQEDHHGHENMFPSGTSSAHVNGGGRLYGQANVNKNYAFQGHHGQQHSQHQDLSSAAHPSSFSHHQHTHSGGIASGSTPFGGASHLQNGFQGLGAAPMSKPPNEHWRLQQEMAQQRRDWASNKVGHAYARIAQGSSKDLVATTANMSSADSEKEQRQRIAADESVVKSKTQSWNELDMGGQTLRYLALPLFAYPFLTKLYLNNNRLRSIPAEIGKLRQLRFLDLSINELASLPPSMGMLANLQELLLFDNQLQILPSEIGNLYQCQMIGLEGNPLQEEFKAMIVERGTKELIVSLREGAKDIDPPAEERSWHQLNIEPIADEDKFTIMNFNTLCQHYCTEALYGYSPSKALDWANRRQRIMDELQLREPDIICLQEVENDAYESYFRPTLAHHDYKGAYWPKGRAKTMGQSEAKIVDGCATFYKNNKFILLDKQLIELSTAAINRPDMKGEPDIYNRVMPKDNIAVLTFFENRMSGARMIVVNAHLHWDHQFKDVKVVQVAVLLEQIGKYAEIYSSWPPLKDKEKQPYRFSNGDSAEPSEAEEPPKPKPSMSYPDPVSIPIIITGDFNSLPDSGPYQLITKGELAPNHSDLEGRSYGKFTKDGISHPFQLRSSYEQIGELPFTNYTSNFEGVVDYVWYSTPSLVVRGLLGEIDPEYIQRVPGFPNIHFPSDHLALVAEFGVKKQRTGG